MRIAGGVARSTLTWSAEGWAEGDWGDGRAQDLLCRGVFFGVEGDAWGEGGRGFFRGGFGV